MLAEHPPFWFVLDLNKSFCLPALDPEVIRANVRKSRTDENSSGHLCMLNSVARGLGFRDWAHFLKMAPDICAFQHKHGLTTPSDLITCERNPYAFKLERRQVADRIFFGPRETTRLFTGAQLGEEDFLFRFRGRPVLDQGVPEQVLDNALASGQSEQLEFVVSKYRIYLMGSYDLLGDNLISPTGKNGWLHKRYFPQDMSASDVKTDMRATDKLFQCFRTLRDREPRGWVEVLRYNDHIAFLKGNDGAYDLVVRNLRNSKPPAPLSELPLPSDYMPSFLLAQCRFPTWFYYQRELWEEKERHASEKDYYRNGGKAGIDYPGSDVILETYLRKNGVFTAQQKSCDKCLPGFVPVTLGDGTKWFVAENYVTVGELRQFLDGTKWPTFRRGQHLDKGNEEPLDRPAAMTWLDAMAFCSAFEEEHDCPVRLLAKEQCRQLLPDRPASQNTDNDWCLVWTPRYVPMAERLNGAAPAEKVQFRDDLTWATSRQGMRFLVAPDFFEWTQDKWVVTPYYPSPNNIHDMDIELWGLHAGHKTAVRLCYPAA